MHRRDGRPAAAQRRLASRSCERDWHFGGIMRRMEYHEPVQSFSAAPIERKLKSCKWTFCDDFEVLVLASQGTLALTLLPPLLTFLTLHSPSRHSRAPSPHYHLTLAGRASNGVSCLCFPACLNSASLSQ